MPVYNSETYLRECIESVLANTYTALELILVDDGSTDTSGEICDEFAQKDPRVKVLHQENSGVVCARNNGLAMATGAYIGFIDSDDTVSPVFYEQMQPYANSSHGRLMAAKHCVRHYIMDMIDEHYQQRGTKTEVDALLDSRPDYLDALNSVGDFADMTPNARYQQYRSAPGKYIAKHRFLGVLMKIKRMIKHFL